MFSSMLRYMHVTEQNKANKPALCSENIGAVLNVEFLKQEITVQKYCLHRSHKHCFLKPVQKVLWCQDLVS